MTHPDLKHLVAEARKDRPAPGVLAAVARSLRVPFVAAPLVAVALPSSAAASVLTKLGLLPAGWLGWGAGSAVAVTGVAAAVLLARPSPPPLPAAPVAPALVRSSAPLPAEEPVPVEEPKLEPQPKPLASSLPRAVKEAPAVWDEPQLIERARKALGTDPRRALSLAQEHQRRFPAGALGVEREVISIEALARSGQAEQARRRALGFEAKYPRSIHLPRIRALRERLER